MEDFVFTENMDTATMPRKKKMKSRKKEPLKKDVSPEGYMSLQQFEKELVDAVVERLC